MMWTLQFIVSRRRSLGLSNNLLINPIIGPRIPELETIVCVRVWLYVVLRLAIRSVCVRESYSSV